MNPCKRVFRHQLLILQVTAKRFDAGNFAADGFRLVVLVQIGDVLHNSFPCQSRAALTHEYGKLGQVDPVGFYGFGIKALLVLAIQQIL